MEIGVGSIVWVRRRNGSWWPGQIIGPDDLSASHRLTSPRSGTPVKLLGREDASVDWYNLEKSKRVKAFRCGDFDDCIERAESSTQGMPLKKREKYARREDAVFHALELERQMMKKQGELGIVCDRINCRSSNTAKNGVVASLKSPVNDDEKCASSKPYISYESEIIGGPFSSASDGNQVIGEVDHSEVTHQMIGLQDFRLKIAPLKGKLPSSVDPNVSQKLNVDDGAQALASGGLCMGSALHTNGVGQLAVPCQAKRSRYVYLSAESSDSLDYKETLTHIETSSSQFGEEFPYHGSLVGNIESAFKDGVESDSSETGSTTSDSDSSETVPDMDEEMTILSETGQDAEEQESASSEELDELAISSDMPHLRPRELITCDEAVSKWQLKGKRNNRNFAKRSIGPPDRKGIIYGVEADAEGRCHSNHKRLNPSMDCYRNGFSDALDDDDDPMFVLEDEYSLTSGAVPKIEIKIHHRADCEEYWDVKGFTPMHVDRYHFGGRRRPVLVNVNLKVQASYRKEPVPIVSLMSKLDGRAIIGHPIQVQALKDGSSDILFSPVDDFGNDQIGGEGSSLLPPAWRTASFRVPGSHALSSSSGAELAAEFPLFQDRNLEYKKLNAGSTSCKVRLRKKGGKKPSKKLAKKVSLSSSQKTRTLSSLSVEHNHSRKPLHDSTSYKTYRLTKPGISGPTTVACIPVQLVFSRLLEKINRPPLKSS